MMAPPKTVSALWATSAPDRRAQIEAAHRQAVASALRRTEREVALLRRKTNGVVRYEKAKSLLAAEFVHRPPAGWLKIRRRAGYPTHNCIPICSCSRPSARTASSPRSKASSSTVQPARTARGIAPSWHTTSHSSDCSTGVRLRRPPHLHIGDRAWSAQPLMGEGMRAGSRPGHTDRPPGRSHRKHRTHTRRHRKRTGRRARTTCPHAHSMDRAKRRLSS